MRPAELSILEAASLQHVLPRILAQSATAPRLGLRPPMASVLDAEKSVSCISRALCGGLQDYFGHGGSAKRGRGNVLLVVRDPRLR